MTEQSLLQDLRRHLAVVHKRRGLFITCVTTSLLAAVLYNYTTRPVYQATALVLIDIKVPELVPGQGSTRMGGEGDLQTEYQLLAGRGLAEAVVQRLQLHKTPEFQTGPLMSPWERFQRKFLDKAPASTVSSDGVPLSPAAAAFRSRLSVEPNPGGRLINLRFRAYDPQLAAEAVNTLANLYIEQALEFRFNASSEANGWLEQRVREQEEKLRQAELALRDFASREGLSEEGSRSAASQNLDTLTGSLAQARSERITKETAYAQLRSLSGAQLESSGALLANPLVQGLRSRMAELQTEQARLATSLGEKHPDMVRLRSEIRALQDKILVESQNAVRLAESEYRSALQNELSLQAAVEAARKSSQQVQSREIELGSLRREVESNRRLLNDLVQRSKQTDLASEVKTANIRIVEKAETPRSPLLPNRANNYRFGLAAGLVLGLALAFLFEHLDNTIRTPEDIKDQLGLPFLGMVPDANARPTQPAAGKPSPLMLKNPQSAAAESYRVLRTNLMFSSGQRTGRAILISSASAGEGKTTTVVNLAASIALNGARILTLDADLRRPTLHQHFGISKAPGLTDLIVGKCLPSEAVQVSRHQGLHVMACGYIAPNPAELLGSRGMKEVIEALRKHYDWLLIDTPPILGMADTAVLCPLVDGVVLVVGSEVSNRSAVQRAVDQITSVGGKVIGVVLNRVNLERNSYYYGQYYGEYYRSYYSEGATARATRK